MMSEVPSVFVVDPVRGFVLLLLDLLETGGEGASWKGGGGGSNGTGGGEVEVEGILLNRARIAGMGVATAMENDGGGEK